MSNRDELIEILNSLYLEYKSNEFYYIPNVLERDIRSQIMDALSERKLKINIDIYVFTSQMNSDVMIKV